MIVGLKFLGMFFSVAIAVIVVALALFLLYFVVTWVIRLLFTGFGVTAKDHYDWVKEHAPKRKDGKYRIYAVDTMNFLFESDNPEIIKYSINHPDQFIVVAPGEELKNV